MAGAPVRQVEGADLVGPIGGDVPRDDVVFEFIAFCCAT
jgi:hypothetical protein